MKISQFVFYSALLLTATAQAAFTDANWVSLGGSIGANGTVYAAVTDGSGNLYIGGTFTEVGNTPATKIAKWDGTNWSSLGIGMSGGDAYGPYVQSLAISNGILYAGGDFSTAGGNPANCIATWDGTNWSALGVGISGPISGGFGPVVTSLQLLNKNLYAGGQFTSAGGLPAANIAQWDGTNWSSLGSGMSGAGFTIVNVLGISAGKLCAGGHFSSIGGTPANSIALWDGTNWLPLGGGMNGIVDSLSSTGNSIFTGGNFTTAGGNAATNIARWDGTNWSALGAGAYADVSAVLALAVSGGTLYAGGAFTNAGGLPANNIASWDGSNWSTLGSGISGPCLDGGFLDINAFVLSGSTLLIVGDFGTAGTNAAHSLAAAIISTPAMSVSILSADVRFGFTNRLFGFNVSGPPGSNVVVKSSPDLQTWTPVQTNQFDTNGLFYFADTQPPSNTQRFYRAQLSP